MLTLRTPTLNTALVISVMSYAAFIASQNTGIGKLPNLALPQASVPLPERATAARIQFDAQQRLCAAKTAYYEARSDGAMGMAMAIQSLINRAKKNFGGFGRTLCDQAHARKKGSRYHQYSYMNNPRTRSAPTPIAETDKRAWQMAQGLAWAATTDTHFMRTHGTDATGLKDTITVLGFLQSTPCGQAFDHYHTTGVNPRWNRNMHFSCQIGSHVLFDSTRPRQRDLTNTDIGLTG